MKDIKRQIFFNFVIPAVGALHLPLPPLPAVCAIIENKGKILAINLSYKNGYSLPGGGLLQNETFEEGLRREVKEETNLDIKDLKYLGSHKKVSNTFSHVSVCFKASVVKLDDMKSSDEGEALWLDPKFLYKNCAYDDVHLHLKDYFGF
jgi:ADP-ribose pyrophosphatase YjhB (NUDIX family)